ncbi:MAG: hypothetical protein ACKVJG_02370 [Candidatus Latescibacterota bacterium]|jgi:hypothetical protein
MGRYTSFLTATFFILLGGANLVRADEINGYIVNPNSDARIGGIEVSFYINQEGQVAEMMRKTADEQGRFSFAGPFLTAGTSFALAAFYKDVTYFSSTLEVGAQKQIILEVYEPTSSDSEIRIGSHHVFLVMEEGTIEVVHLTQIHNGQEQAYTGSGQGGERHVTEFQLPNGIFNLQSHSGHMDQADATTFFDNQPLLPGYSQLSFSFNIDPEQLEDGYLHHVVYPTDRFELFVQPSTLEIGAPFEDIGVVDLHGRQYRRWQMTDLQAGQQVNISLPLAAPLRWVLKWTALGFGLVASIGALFLWSRNDSQDSEADSPISTPDLQTHRQRLLGKIARLDQEYAANRDDTSYLSTRRRLLDQALDLTRLLDDTRKC